MKFTNYEIEHLLNSLNPIRLWAKQRIKALRAKRQFKRGNMLTKFWNWIKRPLWISPKVQLTNQELRNIALAKWSGK